MCLNESITGFFAVAISVLRKEKTARGKLYDRIVSKKNTSGKDKFNLKLKYKILIKTYIYNILFNILD